MAVRSLFHRLLGGLLPGGSEKAGQNAARNARGCLGSRYELLNKAFRQAMREIVVPRKYSVSAGLITLGASIAHEVESLDESAFLLTISWAGDQQRPVSAA
jgi:hypothetical protein